MSHFWEGEKKGQLFSWGHQFLEEELREKGKDSSMSGGKTKERPRSRGREIERKAISLLPKTKEVRAEKVSWKSDRQGRGFF